MWTYCLLADLFAVLPEYRAFCRDFCADVVASVQSPLSSRDRGYVPILAVRNAEEQPERLDPTWAGRVTVLESEIKAYALGPIMLANKVVPMLCHFPIQIPVLFPNGFAVSARESCR